MATRSASASCAGCSSSRSSTIRTRNSNCSRMATARPSLPALQWRNWAADPEGITGEELVRFVNDTLFPKLKKLRPAAGPRANVVRDVFGDAYNYMRSGQLIRQVVNKINGIDFNNLAERQHFGDIYEQILNDLQNAGNAGEYYTPRAVTSFMTQMIDPEPGETLLDPACGTGGFLTCAMRHMRENYVKRPEDEATMQASLRAVEKKPLPHMLAVTNMLLHSVEDPSFLRHDNTLARPYTSWGKKRTGRYRADQSAFRRQGGGRHRVQLPPAFPHARDGGSVPSPDHPPAQTWRPGRRGAAGRLAVRRRRQDAAQGKPDAGMQPAHHRAPAEFRIQALCLNRHKPAVLREGRTDQGHLVLGAPGARGSETLLDD